MITTLMLAAVQAATPVPPAPPAAAPGDRTIVREIVIHEHPAGKSDDKAKDKGQRREIMIIRSGDRAAARGEANRRIRIVDVDPGKPGERREIRILREPGRAQGARVAMLDCDSGSKVDSESVGKDGKKTRVMVCAKGGNQVEALERASKRIAENKELPDDVRTRVLAQMEAQIARLKAGK
jgi:hypothetical protein